VRELIVLAILIGLGLTLVTIPDACDRQRARDSDLSPPVRHFTGEGSDTAGSCPLVQFCKK